jgi:hypothetical protein
MQHTSAWPISVEAFSISSTQGKVITRTDSGPGRIQSEQQMAVRQGFFSSFYREWYCTMDKASRRIW